MISASTIASLLSFYAWLFRSPHRSNGEGAQALDVRLGTFFIIQLWGCLVLLWASPLEICTTSTTRYFVLYYGGLASGLGAILGTSLVCHRYLLAKAAFLVEAMNGRDEAVARLKWNFWVELCVFPLANVGVALWFVFPLAGRVVVAVSAAIMMPAHIFFSVAATSAFLAPLLAILRQSAYSDKSRPLLFTKYLALAGTVITVGSTTALYVHAILMMVWPDRILKDDYLSPTVFSMHLDKMFNCVGMLLSCGIVKPLLESGSQAWSRRKSTRRFWSGRKAQSSDSANIRWRRISGAGQFSC